jgi:hypothetical protein
MSKRVVIINGSGGVGKDTFVKFCSEYTGVVNISSVDVIKSAASILGWNGGKAEIDRKFLSDLKLLATDYNDHSFNYIKECIKRFKYNEQSSILFIHLREPGEIEKLKKEFPEIITLLIKNKNVEGISSNMADANVDKYQYNYVIPNDDTLSDLEAIACSFVKGILK